MAAACSGLIKVTWQPWKKLVWRLFMSPHISRANQSWEGREAGLSFKTVGQGDRLPPFSAPPGEELWGGDLPPCSVEGRAGIP